MVLLLLAVAAAAGMVYHGNRNSHVFHRPGCRYYDCKNCVVVFHSRQEALEAGFRPCKVCNP
ncbi:MAG: Ada metal-binding domain-containing protein [Desulfovibrionaceae bacterium]